MNQDVFFNQACPVCGRTLHVLVQLLGRRVYCQHCGGGFVATAESTRRQEERDPARSRAEVVDELLARATVQLQEFAQDRGGGDLANHGDFANEVSVSHR